MQVFLISGGKKEERKEKTRSVLTSSVSQIDTSEFLGADIGIKDVRNIIRSLFLKPVESEKKAIILLEAQELSIEAQNALLKTLEEPPSHAIIILTTPNSELLLPTIISRCQVIELTTDNQNLMTENQSLILNHLSFMINGGVGEKLKFAQDLSKNKEEAITWLEKMILSARKELINNTLNKKNHLASQYLNILISLQKTHTIIKTTNANPRLTLENLLINL